MKIVVKIIAGLLIAAILVVVGFFGYKLYQNGFNFNKTFGIGVSEKLVEEKELTIIKEIDIIKAIIKTHKEVLIFLTIPIYSPLYYNYIIRN